MSDEKKTDAAPPAVSSESAPSTATPSAPTLAKIPRSRQQIMVDYTNTSAQLGQLVYELAVLEQQKDALLAKIDQLGREAKALPPEPAKAPVALKQVPPPPAPKASGDGT